MRFAKIKNLLMVLPIVVVAPIFTYASDAPPANRISIERARAVAVHVYSGKIQSEELEFEDGRWIYSFDLKSPKDKRVHEIHVDALSGKLLNSHTETPADERKELQEDQALSGAATTKFPLTASEPITLPGKIGRFDFMEVDLVNERLLAAHAGGGSLALVDLKNGKLLSAITVGDVQGIAIDDKSGTYILGDADEHKIVFVSSRTLAKTGELAVTGPVDAIAFDPKNGLAYAGEDDGSQLWIVNVKTQKLVTALPISGVPEYVAYDPKTDRIYQNIKTKDSVAAINPNTNKVEAEWSTLPATGPHGLAIDGKAGHLFIAGHNGKLIEIDLKSGKVIAQVEIAPGTDQIAFDSTAKIIYTASKEFISVVRETETGLEVLGNVQTHAGAHTLAVDSIRHEVWISYADKQSSYLQKFKAATK